jgi:hypothetical protein
VSAASTPWLVRGRIGGRSDRPRSSVGPDPEYHYKEIRRRRRHHRFTSSVVPATCFRRWIKYSLWTKRRQTSTLLPEEEVKDHLPPKEK